MPRATRATSLTDDGIFMLLNAQVNQQCVVYEFQCSSRDSNYKGYTSRHLHLRF